jgi:hypothetical protein
MFNPNQKRLLALDGGGIPIGNPHSRRVTSGDRMRRTRSPETGGPSP